MQGDGQDSQDGAAPGSPAPERSTQHYEPSPCELLAYHLGVSAAKLERLLQRQPEVLQLPANRLVPRLQRLSHVMRLPMEQVLVMVARHPGVLSAPPSLIISKARDMLRKLGLPKESIMPLLARQPEFLEVPIEKLISRCELLSSCLGVDTLAAAMALSRLPPTPLFAVLGLRPTFLPVRMVELGRLLQVSTSVPAAQVPGTPLPDDPTLSDDGRIAFTPLLMRTPLPGAEGGVPREEWAAVRRNLRRAATAIEQRSFEAGRLPEGPGVVARMLLTCPQLLLVPMRSLAASYQALRDLLQLSPSKMLIVLKRSPKLLLISPASLQATSTCLQRTLGLTRDALATRMVQQPQLLELSGQQVTERLARLGTALGWSAASVHRAVRNQPQLLTASPSSVAFKVTALAAMLRIPRAVADDMAKAQPGLLTLAVPTILRNLRGLQDVLLAPAAKDAKGSQQPARAQVAQQPARQSPCDAQQEVGSLRRRKRQSKGAEEAGRDSPSATGKTLAMTHHGVSQLEENTVAGHSQPDSSNSAANAATPAAQALLVFPHTAVVDAAVMHPTLLTLPPRTLTSKAEALQRLLRLDTWSLQALMLSNPLLLSVSRANLLFRLNEVQLVLQLPFSGAAQLMVANPELVIGTPPQVWMAHLFQALGDDVDVIPHEEGSAGAESAEGRAMRVLKRLVQEGKQAKVQAVLQRVQAVLASQGFT